MVKVSDFVVPETEKVTVRVEVPTEMLAAVMSLLPLKETLPTPELNCHPLGSVRVKVLLFPTAKSVVAASVRTMLPNAVNAAPLVELTHLSAERSLPPTGSVMITSASRWVECRATKPKTRARGHIVFFMLYRGGVKSQPYLEEDATSFHWTEFLINSQPSQSGQPAIVASGQELVRTPGNPR